MLEDVLSSRSTAAAVPAPAAPSLPRLLAWIAGPEASEGEEERSAEISRRRERALIRAAQDGSEEAIERLFRHWWPVAFRAASFITRDAAAAEDIAQESFLAAIRNLDAFDRTRPFGPWFKRLVVNRAIDWTRARQIRGRQAEREAEQQRAAARAGDRDRPPHAPGLPDDLGSALRALPTDQRTVVALRHLLEYTPGEIADLLGVPRGTVNSRLRRGLDALRDEIDAIGDER